MSLQDLIVSEEKLSDEILERILKKYVRFGQESGSIIFTPEARKIPIRNQILVYLVARKAYPKLFPDKKELKTQATAVEIAKMLGLNDKTISARLSELKKEGRLDYQKGNYTIKTAFLDITADELDMMEPKISISSKRDRRSSKVDLKYRAEVLQKMVDYYDDEKYWQYFKKESHLKLIDKYMLVLKIAKEAGIESMRAEEVKRFLTEPPVNLPSKIYTNNISRDFGKKRDFITPEKRGRGYLYRLTRPGEEYLDNLLKPTEQQSNE